jgi:hypothetical protein
LPDASLGVSRQVSTRVGSRLPLFRLGNPLRLRPGEQFTAGGAQQEAKALALLFLQAAHVLQSVVDEPDVLLLPQVERPRPDTETPAAGVALRVRPDVVCLDHPFLLHVGRNLRLLCLEGSRIPGDEGLEPITGSIADRMVAAGAEIQRRIVGGAAVTTEREIEPLRAGRATAARPV